MLLVRNISKSFGSTQVLAEISFKVEKSSFISVFGPNGSGKTTLLNIISGLEKSFNGEIFWENQVEKNVSYVFQNYRETLFPWMYIWENIALPLKLKGADFNTRKRKVRELVQKFSLDIDLYKYPYQLSGGQQQLAAILRAIITKPALLLMDEPFSALDFKKRLFLQNKVLEIWEEMKTTVIFVSHDLEEAIYMADKILLLGDKPTRLVREQQILLERPRSIKTIVSFEFIQAKEILLNSFLFGSESETETQAYESK